jgi:hypothetical protein
MAQRVDPHQPAPASAGWHDAWLRWRIERAHELAAKRRIDLLHWLDGVDSATFARNGFVVKRQVLPPDQFEALSEQVQSRRGTAREMLMGDTVTRHIPVDEAFVASAPALAALLQGRLWNGLTRYVAASRRAPQAYVQTVVTHTRLGVRDPQTLLHSDAFAPTMKAWYFLNDVGDDDAPLCYVPGSHRLTPARLAWELRQARRADAPHLDGHATKPNGLPPDPRRVDKSELASMDLGLPARLVVPANTLIVADTFGFHKRAQARHPTMRVELWAGSGAATAHDEAWHPRGPLSAAVLPHWKAQDRTCEDPRRGVY